MSAKSDIFLDLNKRLANRSICSSEYRTALEYLHHLPEEDTEEAPQPPKFLTITFDDDKGFRIEKPVRELFSADQRYSLRLARYALIGVVACGLMLLQACGQLI